MEKPACHEHMEHEHMGHMHESYDMPMPEPCPMPVMSEFDMGYNTFDRKVEDCE